MLEEPAPDAGHYDPLDLDHPVIEVEQAVTKEVHFHVLRAPSGRPLSYHRSLEAALDALDATGHTRGYLRAGAWAVVIDLKAPVPATLL